MSIEVESNIVKRDGEQIGTVIDGKVQVSAGTHWKTREAIATATGLEVAERDVAPTEIPTPTIGLKNGHTLELEPVMDHRGDKTPNYIGWYRRNHTEEEFQRKYAGRKLA